jgi:3-hydroxyisobutyrate dehydrogenase
MACVPLKPWRHRDTAAARFPRKQETQMANTRKLGWIGMGRMGYPMAERLLKAGYDVSIWNRTRAKAEPLAALGGKDFVAAPVSGNAKVIKAGKLSAVISGPEAVCKTVMPMIEVFAPSGVSHVGDGELARVCKIAHNVMLGVVIENLIEITLLANKMGVPRHAFLAFMNNSVMGSMFTRYKSPALVNLDWTTTFTPELLRKDLDLGLELGREHDVPMPVTAATREVLQAHFGAATLKSNPDEYLQKDFAALMETMGLMAGMALKSENKNVPTGLE